MGRHSVSYIAAQQDHGTGTTAVGAAKCVGRVGALALAMGVGAAVAGGGGIAYAEGPTDNGTGGGGGAETTSDKTVDKVNTAVGSPSDVKTRRPGLFNVPKMMLGGSGAPSSLRPSRQGLADADPGSLPGMIASIPGQIATVFGNGAHSDSPPRVRPQSQGNTRPNGGPGQSRPTTPDDGSAAQQFRGVADDAAAALRADAQPLGVVSSRTVGTILPQRAVVTPDTATTRPPSLQPVADSATLVAARTSTQTTPVRPVRTVLTGLLSALGVPSAANTGGTPVAPAPIVLAALALIRREFEQTGAGIDHALNGLPSAALILTQSELEGISTRLLGTVHPTPGPVVTTPSPTDSQATPYGNIGKWMLQPNGQIANYGDQPLFGKQNLEPVNVIIIDRSSTSEAGSRAKVDAAMTNSGFPSQPIHSTGQKAVINGEVKDQLFTGEQEAYSDNLYFLPNDHGRVFGPEPLEGGGYVWTGAFSTETPSIYNGAFTHSYVSYGLARDVLVLRMLLSGQATFGGVQDVNNASNTATTTTGDHDGKAVVLILK